MKFSLKQKRTADPTSAGSGFHKFFLQKYGLLVLILLFIGIGFSVYEIYTVTYDTLIVKKTINPTDLQRKQEQINIKRYEGTRSSLQRKQSATQDTEKIKEIFSAGVANTSGSTQAPLP